jgi:hypothetical protein
MSMKSASGTPLFQVTGGSVSAQAIAVGDGARATVTNAAAGLKAEGRDELLERLTAVLDAIEAHGMALPDKATADAMVERIASESARKEPDKLSLKSFLGTLADQVKSVSIIATTVTALAGTIGALF